MKNRIVFLLGCLSFLMFIAFVCSACDGGAGGCGPVEPPPTPTPTPTPAGEIREGDPGTGPFVLVPDSQVADECGLDPALLNEADRVIGTDYIVVRYGKLCHQFLPSGSDTNTEVWSTTKTLGAVVTGIASYETRNIPRTGRKTGPLSDTDRVDHWLDNFSYNRNALVAHVMSMVAHNNNLNNGRLRFSYDAMGTVQINSLSDIVNQAISQDPARLGNNIEQFTQRFLYEPLGMTNSTWSNGRADKTYAYTWNTTLKEMARVGLLVLHNGMYNGNRILDESWIYRMTHPSFEEANTGYGYLTWLNTRGGGAGVGGDFSGNVQFDLCAPPALWNSYPHFPSTYPDCKADPGFSCEQTYDAGVWSAQGFEGQFIAAHPGLDLLIVAKDFQNGGGPTGLWAAIRPALVALDPTYAGDEDAFCEAYGSSNYAPDMDAQPMP